MCILCHFGTGFLFRLQLAIPLYVAIATSDGTSDDKVGIGKTLGLRSTNGGTLFSWMSSTTVHWTRATMCNIIYIDYYSMVYNKKSLCLFRLHKYVKEMTFDITSDIIGGVRDLRTSVSRQLPQSWGRLRVHVGHQHPELCYILPPHASGVCRTGKYTQVSGQFPFVPSLAMVKSLAKDGLSVDTMWYHVVSLELINRFFTLRTLNVECRWPEPVRHIHQDFPRTIMVMLMRKLLG